MEWIKRNIALVLLTAGCVVLSLFLFQTCESKNQIKRDLESYESFWETERDQLISRDSIKTHDLRVVKQNLTSEIASKEILKEEFERFKSINSHVRFETITKVETLFVRYNDFDTSSFLDSYAGGFVPVDTVKKHFLKTPRPFSRHDMWFSVDGMVTNEGVNISEMSFVNKFDVTIGYQKPDKPLKFLRKSVPVIELSSYNPYTKTSYINNIVVDDKQKGSFERIFMSKPAFFIYGLAAGFGLSKIKQ